MIEVPGQTTQVSIDHAGAGVGHGGGTQNAESVGGVEDAGVSAKCKEREKYKDYSSSFI